MSIITKRGDGGTTDMLFGKRVPKNDARMEAIGAVDELNATLGVARVLSNRNRIDEWIDGFQKQLTGLMGELAVMPEDASNYAGHGYPTITSGEVEALEETARQLDISLVKPNQQAAAAAAPAESSAPPAGRRSKYNKPSGCMHGSTTGPPMRSQIAAPAGQSAGGNSNTVNRLIDLMGNVMKRGG